MIRLLIGLGNPGKRYQGTRHNVGFALLDRCADSWGLFFQRRDSFCADLAEGRVGSEEVVLFKPLTFMNASGEAVALFLRHRRVGCTHLLVVADDVALPLGQLRLREGGGTGGHNGLKSVESALGTSEYPRLRIGVGRAVEEDLSDYVLAPFTAEEGKLLPSLFERGREALLVWMEQGVNRAMECTNREPPPSLSG